MQIFQIRAFQITTEYCALIESTDCQHRIRSWDNLIRVTFRIMRNWS